MAVCAGIKRNGGRCTVSVPAGQEFCHHHDPARAEERRRAASRAGKSRPSREISEIKTLLSELTDRVLGEGDAEILSTGVASTVVQIVNAKLRTIEVERRVREQEELLERLERLERAAARLDSTEEGRRSWGA